MELGTDIKITIVTPGIIESEFTKGKVWTESGMKVDQDLRDVSSLSYLSKITCSKVDPKNLIFLS